MANYPTRDLDKFRVDVTSPCIVNTYSCLKFVLPGFARSYFTPITILKCVRMNHIIYFYLHLYSVARTENLKSI